MCLLHMAKVQLNILDCNGDNNVYVYHKAQPLLDTQNVLGSCTVSLAMGPGSLSPPEKKRTLNFKSTKASPLLAYAKGCQRTFTQERGRAGTQPSSCVLHLSQHRIKYL